MKSFIKALFAPIGSNGLDKEMMRTKVCNHTKCIRYHDGFYILMIDGSLWRKNRNGRYDDIAITQCPACSSFIKPSLFNPGDDR